MSTKSLAFVLNVSINHYKGKRIIDTIKKQLIKLVRDLDIEDTFYLYSSDKFEVLTNRGDQVASIANYDDKIQNLYFAIKQSLNILEVQDKDNPRILFYITDLCEQNDVKHLKKAFISNKGFLYDPSEILIISIGNSPLSSFENYHQLDDPTDLYNRITTILESY